MKSTQDHVINGAIGPLKAHFALDANWTGWAMGCALLGCAIGAGTAGLLSDRFGRKKVLILSAVLFFISAVGTAIPKTITVFIIYRILGGVGVGAASISSPMYIAEISPARIRGRMVSVNQFAIVTGFLVVYFANYFIALQGDAAWNEQSGWRWMFASEALPALLLLVLLFFVPESPRWLAKQNRDTEALEILTRVDGAAYAKTELLEIEDAIAHESGSLRQLLQPGMKIVLVIGIVLAVLQQVTGINVFLYFGTEIFKKMGSGTNAALLQTVVVGGVNLSFTVLAIWTVDRLGRKPLMMIGSAGMGISLLAMGLAAYFQKTELWMLLFILSYIACFALSVGPVTWVILSEIFPTRIRGRAMAVATVCLWVANYVISTFPMMDENAWLVGVFHHAFPFWLYGVFCIVLLIFVCRFVRRDRQGRGRSSQRISGMVRDGTHGAFACERGGV
ncbi:MAG: sugar porter family MFS transporter [Planctomycetota bacterium]|jgi:SP family xylose:H+ symportor-like MFS transporter